MGEGYIEEVEDKSCRDQRASIEEDIRIEGDSWSQYNRSRQRKRRR